MKPSSIEKKDLNLDWEIVNLNTPPEENGTPVSPLLLENSSLGAVTQVDFSGQNIRSQSPSHLYDSLLSMRSGIAPLSVVEILPQEKNKPTIMPLHVSLIDYAGDKKNPILGSMSSNIQPGGDHLLLTLNPEWGKIMGLPSRAANRYIEIAWNNKFKLNLKKRAYNAGEKNLLEAVPDIINNAQMKYGVNDQRLFGIIGSIEAKEVVVETRDSSKELMVKKGCVNAEEMYVFVANKIDVELWQVSKPKLVLDQSNWTYRHLQSLCLGVPSERLIPINFIGTVKVNQSMRDGEVGYYEKTNSDWVWVQNHSYEESDKER